MSTLMVMRYLAMALALVGVVAWSTHTTRFEDGSAVYSVGPVVITVPAFDSPGDHITVEGATPDD